MAMSLFAAGLANLYGHSELTFVFILALLFFFECSAGPILWLYLSEIMRDKGTSFASGLNWTAGIIVSFITPLINKALTIHDSETGKATDRTQVGYMFIGFGIINIFSSIFTYIFVIESQGLTFEQIEELYAKAAGYTGYETMSMLELSVGNSPAKKKEDDN